MKLPVSPPTIDQDQAGFRVPALLVSPFARRGYIDHRSLDHTSILRFIEDNYRLPSLTSRDSGANSLVEAFDFSRPPRQAAIVSMSRSVAAARSQVPKALLYAVYGFAIGLAILLLTIVLLRLRMPTPGGAAVIRIKRGAQP